MSSIFCMFCYCTDLLYLLFLVNLTTIYIFTHFHQNNIVYAYNSHSIYALLNCRRPNLDQSDTCMFLHILTILSSLILTSRLLYTYRLRSTHPPKYMLYIFHLKFNCIAPFEASHNQLFLLNLFFFSLFRESSRSIHDTGANFCFHWKFTQEFYDANVPLQDHVISENSFIYWLI